MTTDSGAGRTDALSLRGKMPVESDAEWGSYGYRNWWGGFHASTDPYLYWTWLKFAVRYLFSRQHAVRWMRDRWRHRRCDTVDFHHYACTLDRFGKRLDDEYRWKRVWRDHPDAVGARARQSADPAGCSALSDVDEVADLTCTHCGAPVQLTGRNRIVNTDGEPHTCQTASGVGEKGGSDRTREAPSVGESGAQLHPETVEPGRVNDRAPDPRSDRPGREPAP